MVEALERRISRRTFLEACVFGAMGASCSFLRVSDLGSIIRAVEKMSSISKVRETLNAIWDGRINLTFIDIVGYAAGQVQAIGLNPQTQEWDPEYAPTFAWIHRLPDNPYAFRGLFFIHRSNLSLVEKEKGLIPPNTEIRFYADWNHDSPVLLARLGMRAIYSASKIDDPEDPLVKLVAKSYRTIAFVTCHPPNYQGENPLQRLVYFAWASLPETTNCPSRPILTPG